MNLGPRGCLYKMGTLENEGNPVHIPSLLSGPGVRPLEKVEVNSKEHKPQIGLGAAVLGRG